MKILRLRRALRRHAAMHEPSFLNIVPMLDIVTIILVFLLKSMSESSAAVPQSDDLKLPPSIAKREASERGVVVTVSKTQILVGDRKVVDLPERDSMVQSGAGERVKRGSPNDLYIVPLGAALKGARSIDPRLREKDALVVADETTPYRLLCEVLFTLGQHELSQQQLLVVQSSTR
jgi:biopolymer transport protein ExbD